MILAATPPLTATPALALVAAVVFGALFGFLLHRGGVACHAVIVNQFRLRDFTVLKIMLTAIVVGGIGVLALHGADLANYHVKPANLLGIVLGAAIFGVGMVLYGYCPGTALAAAAAGSLHAWVGFVGFIVGGTAYAFCYPWIAAHVLPIGALGKVRLPDITGVPSAAWFSGLALLALIVFVALERHERRRNAPPSA